MVRRPFLASLIAFVAFAAPVRTAAADTVPQTVVLDGARLAANRAKLERGDARLQRELLVLVATADDDLRAGPWSVMQKSGIAPSGDKHDYFSQAPYEWATQPVSADNPHGCPYVRKDGQRNPEAEIGKDHAARATAWPAMYDLALAWYYTRNPVYAQRAALDIRTWFLDPATAMNPNMSYSQTIPCSKLPPSGIIDSSQVFGLVVDAVAILGSGAPGWTPDDSRSMRAWMTTYLEWMQQREQGKATSAQRNNPANWKAAQDIAMAVYLGQIDLAKKIVSETQMRLGWQINADGSQPTELVRAIPWHYSLYNLAALCRVAATAKRVGVDLWSYTNAQGASMTTAVDYLIPAAERGTSAWPHPDLQNPIPQSIALLVLHAADDYGHDAAAHAAIPLVPPPAGGDLWALEPTCLNF